MVSEIRLRSSCLRSKHCNSGAISTVQEPVLFIKTAAPDHHVWVNGCLFPPLKSSRHVLSSAGASEGTGVLTYGLSCPGFTFGLPSLLKHGPDFSVFHFSSPLPLLKTHLLPKLPVVMASCSEQPTPSIPHRPKPGGATLPPFSPSPRGEHPVVDWVSDQK